MIQEVNYSDLLQTIEKMQEELRALHQEVVKLRILQAGKADKDHKPFKALRGIFPPAKLTMDDFREVRRSGTPHSPRDT